MIDLKPVSLKIRNYKCFGAQDSGFETILPINLVIGRNNTGKSALLDLISYIVRPTDFNPLGHKGQAPQVTVSTPVSEAAIRHVFDSRRSGGEIWGNHFEYGKDWIGARLSSEVKMNGSYSFLAIDPPFTQNIPDYANALVRLNQGIFQDFRFKRLLADRAIVPEEDGNYQEIFPDGKAATAIIQRFINKTNLPSDLVEKKLLGELNAIFKPDAEFEDIVVQQHANGPWEIYLEETEKGRVPLSHTGSGVKTILLVLAFLYLLPHLEKAPLSQYLFGFEELENNLHPALQRRLLLYLRKIALESNCRFFLTTHSNVAIDLFAHDPEAQILHVTHDRTCASVRKIVTYVDNKGILDDLDVRASDLLQANGIVWVEGPSDRLYFNRWIDVVSKGAIKEGAHYQCVFYGGRLLAHLSATDQGVHSEEAVKILTVNRHAIVIMDSDKNSLKQSLDQTKQRILDEVKSIGGMAWITEGKEIENYIPQQAVDSLFNQIKSPKIGRFEEFSHYLNSNIKKGEGEHFLRNKVLFAERIGSHITESGMQSAGDLWNKVDAALTLIKSWNGMKA